MPRTIKVTEVVCMTVGDLKKQLKKVPDDYICVLQRDPEGNGYSPLDSVERDLEFDAKNFEVAEGDATGIPCVVFVPKY